MDCKKGIDNIYSVMQRLNKNVTKSFNCET